MRQETQQVEPAAPAVVVPPASWLVAVALGIVYVVWGSTYLAIRVVVEDLPPMASASWRYFVAALLLGAILAVRSGVRRLLVTRRELLGCAILHGPHVRNFIDAYRRLAIADAAVLVRSEDELSDALVATMAPDRAAAMAASAWEVVSEGAAVTDTVIAAIAAVRPIRPAAVLVPIIERDELSVLFTQRTAHLADHAGQISFPSAFTPCRSAAATSGARPRVSFGICMNGCIENDRASIGFRTALLANASAAMSALPQKRTFVSALSMSALCQKRTSFLTVRERNC